MNKKIISLIMAIVISVSAFQFAFAANTAEEETTTAAETTTSAPETTAPAKDETKPTQPSTTAAETKPTTTQPTKPAAETQAVKVKITGITNEYEGVKIKWEKVNGIKKYVVYRKSGKENYAVIGEVSGNSFIDKKAVSGTKYTYLVKYITSTGKTMGLNNAQSITFVKAPKITKITNTAKDSVITWSKSQGTAKYKLYLLDSNKKWKCIATTANTTFTHKNLKNGTVYTYTVKCVDKNGKVISGYNKDGTKNTFIAPPAFSSIEPAKKGNLLKWKAVKGADGYKIYRKDYKGSFKEIATVMGKTAYTDTTAKSTAVYAYTIRCVDKNKKNISTYKTDTKYYYGGKIANGKITVNKEQLYFTKGEVLKGYVTVKDNKYYYNSKGFLQKDVIIGSKKDGYAYADKSGKVNTKFTGVAKKSDGTFWYMKKGKIDLNYRDAITYNKKDWLILNGKAKAVKTEDDKTLFRAFKALAKATNSSMTKAEKLKASFDYVKKTYTELSPRVPHFHGDNWQILYANDMFVRGGGNCFSYSCAFAYMAKAIGYKNIYCCNSGGHGWAEIEGKVYDPEWSRHYHKYSYYALDYNTKTDVNYKNAFNKNVSWMYVKIA